MPFVEQPPLRYWTSNLLTAAGIPHGVFTRRGGVSPPPWASLNLGNTVGDDRERVQENLRRVFAALGRSLASRYDVWQVHGRAVVCAQAPRAPDQPHRQADAILTDRPEVTLVMRFADCVPILLADPVRRVVGLVHAGWRGTVVGAVRAAVEHLVSCYGSRPADLLAVVGPSIGPDHYQVGEEVAQQVRAAFGAAASALLPVFEGRIHFDLWAANRLWLEQAGVRHIEVAGLCTACHLDDWYSHRAEKGKTGRFGAVIGLPG